MNSKENRPRVCRIAKVDGRDNLLLGRDFADIFKEGHVYQVIDQFGMIVFKDLGKHAKSEDFDYKSNSYLLMNEMPLRTESEAKEMGKS